MTSSARASDRVLSISLSVLVHAAIVAALLWGWWQYRTPKSVPPSLAIQATVVQSAPATAPAPPTPPVDAAALARAQAERERIEAAKRQAEQQEAADRAAATKAAQLAEETARASEAARQLEATRRAQEAQLEAQRKAEAVRKAREAAELMAKQDAERESQRLAQQLQAEQAERQRESDLRSQLQAEEHLQALQSSPAKAEYLALIEARISRAWIRPPSSREGVRCVVHLTQIPGGEITHVSVDNCNGDDALRQSVETAAYRASPLPAPPDPALFDPNLTVTFAPDD